MDGQTNGRNQTEKLICSLGIGRYNTGDYDS